MSLFKIHQTIKSICSALPNIENAKRDMWTPDKKTGPIPVPDMPIFRYGDREIKRYYDVEGYRLYFRAYFNSSDVFKRIEKVWLQYKDETICLNVFEYIKLKRTVCKRYKKEQIVKTNRKFLDKLGVPPKPNNEESDE
jgi:hypothetical protein